MTLVIQTGANKEACHDVIEPVFRDVSPRPAYRYVSADTPYPAQDGEVVLACGAKPKEFLEKARLIPRNRTLNKLREAPIPSARTSGVYMMTFDPGIVFSDPARRYEIQWDIRLAIRYLATGSLIPAIGGYGYVDSIQDVLDDAFAVYAETSRVQSIAIDLETVSLNPFIQGAQILSLSVTYRNHTASVLTFPDGQPTEAQYAEIRSLLTDPRLLIRGANLKFDLLFIRVMWQLVCSNFKFDALIVASILDENRHNSLESLSKIYTSIGGYDAAMTKADKGKMAAVMKGTPDKFLAYAAGDTIATQEVSDRLRGELVQDRALCRFYTELLHPAVRAFEAIEYRGVRVNVEKLYALKKELEDFIAVKEQEAINLLPNRIKIKYKDNLSLSRPAILEDYFFSGLGCNLTPYITTEKTGKPSTARNHLKMFRENPEAGKMVQVLEDLSGAQKTLNTFVVGFLKHLCSDGRFHPFFFLFRGAGFGDDDGESGTVSGRLSAKAPAFQTIPKATRWAKALRSCYEAPPGYHMFEMDASQGELRLTADRAADPTMIQIYREGGDLHAVTAASILGYPVGEFLQLLAESPKEMKPLRNKGKPANFGLIYGMQAKGFKDYAFSGYGVSWTLEEATAIRDRFFQTYQRLPEWHKEEIARAKRKGYVRSNLGRVRHLPLIRSSKWELASRAERQTVNSPIQADLSDLGLLALARIEQELPEDKICIIGQVHDSVVGYVTQDNPYYWLRQAKEIAETLPLQEVFGWTPRVPLPWEVEIGPDLGHMKEISDAELEET